MFFSHIFFPPRVNFRMQDYHQLTSTSLFLLLEATWVMHQKYCPPTWKDAMLTIPFARRKQPTHARQTFENQQTCNGSRLWRLTCRTSHPSRKTIHGSKHSLFLAAYFTVSLCTLTLNLLFHAMIFCHKRLPKNAVSSVWRHLDHCFKRQQRV